MTVDAGEGPPRRGAVWKRRATFALQVAVSVGLLAAVFRTADQGRVLSAVRDIDWSTWTMGLALMSVGPAIAAARTRAVLRSVDADLPLLGILAINMESMFFNLVLPGDVAGGVVRWARFSARVPRRASMLAVILVERAFDWLVLCGVVAATAGLLFDGADAGRDRTLVRTAAAATAVVAVVGLAVGRSRLGTRALARFASGRRGRTRALARRGRAILRGVRASTASVRGVLVVLALTAAYLAPVLLGTFVMAQAVFPTMPMGPFVAATCALVVLTQLPLTVAGLGLRELSFPVLLGAYGVDRETAVVLGASGFVPYVCMGLIGLVVHLSRRAKGPGARPTNA